MNVLDENIIASQCKQLRRWRIRFRQVGQHGMGRVGMDDSAHILPLLHRLSRPTFFTRDEGFYDRMIRHPSYCIVVLSVAKDQAAQLRSTLSPPSQLQFVE